MSAHALLVSLHAAAGTTALLTGIVATWKPRVLQVRLTALVACILLLAGAIAIDWEGLSTGTRALYLALLLLGGYMVMCGQRPSDCSDARWRTPAATSTALVYARSAHGRLRDHLRFVPPRPRVGE
jgi:hypothetical protein